MCRLYCSMLQQSCSSRPISVSRIAPREGPRGKLVIGVAPAQVVHLKAFPASIASASTDFRWFAGQGTGANASGGIEIWWDLDVHVFANVCYVGHLALTPQGWTPGRTFVRWAMISFDSLVCFLFCTFLSCFFLAHTDATNSSSGRLLFYLGVDAGCQQEQCDNEEGEGVERVEHHCIDYL
jgi:hypothetical protein